MHITHHQQQDSGRFVAQQTENQLSAQAGVLDYHLPQTGVMSINHIVVDKAFRGQGIARQLLDAAVLHARTQNMQIVPICSYARAVFQKNAGLQRLLYK